MIQNSIFGGYVEVREPLYVHVIVWVNPFQIVLILGPFGLGMKVLTQYIDPNGIKNTNVINHPYPTSIRKKVKFALQILEWYHKKDDTKSLLVESSKIEILKKEAFLLVVYFLVTLVCPGSLYTQAFNLISIFHWPCNAQMARKMTPTLRWYE